MPGYIVMYRPCRGVPWVELGRAATMFEALAFVNTKGMFWLQTIHKEETTGSDAGPRDNVTANSGSRTPAQAIAVFHPQA